MFQAHRLGEDAADRLDELIFQRVEIQNRGPGPPQSVGGTGHPGGTLPLQSCPGRRCRVLGGIGVATLGLLRARLRENAPDMDVTPTVLCFETVIVGTRDEVR